MDKRIYLCLAHMSGKEQGFIKEAFDTNWVVPLGPNVNAFEEELESFIGNNKKSGGFVRWDGCHPSGIDTVGNTSR